MKFLHSYRGCKSPNEYKAEMLELKKACPCQSGALVALPIGIV